MRWSTVKKVLKYGSLFLLFLGLFFIWTFPYSRLGPKIAKPLEQTLSQILGTRLRCQLNGFDFHLPLGAKFTSLSCSNNDGEVMLDMKNAKLTALPGYQKLSGDLQGGKIELKSNAGFNLRPSHISGKLSGLPLKPFSPLVSQLASKAVKIGDIPTFPNLQVEGMIEGEFDIPLVEIHRRAGSLNFDLKNLKLPAQSTLNLIGLKELNFTKASIKANLSAGKLSLSDVSLVSEHLSGKAEGSIDIAEELNKSTPNLSLKWKVARSDALLSSPFGSMLASAPCPNADSEGYCSRRINRLQDLRIQ